VASFSYKAFDANGKEVKGFFEADSARQVRQYIRDQGFSPLSVDESEQSKKSNQPNHVSNQSLTASENALFTRQLSTLISSGTPLEEALLTISQHSEKQKTKSLVLSVRSALLEGQSLSNSFANFPKAFDELYCSTVDAGEQSGHLEAVLERLADYSEARQETMQKVKVAMFYPAILLLMAVLIVSGLLAYVVPQVVQVFDGNEQKLPYLTVAILALSDFLQANWLYLLVGIAGTIFVYKQALKNELVQTQNDLFLLKIPVIKKFIKTKNTVQFTRTLSILSSSGVPVLQAMSIAASVIGNRPMREAVKVAAAKVREGASIYKSLEQSNMFPPLALHLIASGENSGELDVMLERAAEFQERELNSLIAILVGVFEPVVILVMGVAVLLIVLAILLPIFELNQLIQ
jgi:general secretion pathway protein F